MSLKTHRLLTSTRRGDTIIEVMFAIAVFCLVAVISIAMMNTGVSRAENSLELVTARNELNAQAEALRFIHSSYISEATLPKKGEAAAGEKVQQYDELWQKIANNALNPSDYNLEYPLTECETVYRTGAGANNLLARNNAFIINTRDLLTDIDDAYVSAAEHQSVFQPAEQNARLVFTSERGGDSTSEVSERKLYNRLAGADGIWVVAVKSEDGTNDPSFYDFYIQTCWYGPNAARPTSLDTVIRLYNPAGVTGD